MKVVITCEHGGNRIPAKYWPLFRKHRALLASHRGYDPGALAIARDFAGAFDAELVYSTTSRLLVELNRSRGHHRLFSEITRKLPAKERRQLLERYYEPYRGWVEEQVRAATSRRMSVVHLSCHSFTPRLEGVERRADVGLLYDPARARELDFARCWQEALRKAAPHLRVRRNYPYRGYDDGLTTALRKRFADALYAGVELEVNQKYPLGDAPSWRALRKTLVRTFTEAIAAAR
jgi:predicted N-formylglutamate amidohydrolase